MKILRIGCVLVGFLYSVLSLSAQTFTILHSFDGPDGEYPAAGLIQAPNGDLYGTTLYGGNTAPYCDVNGCGMVFRLGQLR